MSGLHDTTFGPNTHEDAKRVERQIRGIEPGLPYDLLDDGLVPWETPARRGEAEQALIDAMRAEHLRSLRPPRDKERDAERKRRRQRERAARRRNRRRR